MKADGTDWTVDAADEREGRAGEGRGGPRGGGEERAATRTPEFANIERGRNVRERIRR